MIQDAPELVRESDSIQGFTQEPIKSGFPGCVDLARMHGVGHNRNPFQQWSRAEILNQFQPTAIGKSQIEEYQVDLG